jgi:ATP-dependent Clp protease ATP-binding subunit ClpA
MLEKLAQSWADLDREDCERLGIQPVFGRRELVDPLVELMEGPQPAAVVVVGPARAGKTALIQHVANRAITGEADHAFWFANAPRLVASDPFGPGWQEQARVAFAELEDTAGILFMGRIVEALDAGKHVGSDYNLAQFMKPLLTDRRLRIVCEATPDEWAAVERRDVGFARAFTVLRIDDPNDREAFDIVGKAADRLSEREGVEVHADAISRAWHLQRRFATEGSPLGRTIDFLGRSMRHASNHFVDAVTEEMIVEAFCQDTGLPPVLLLDDRTLDLERVREQLSRRVMGQELAVRRVADVVGITKAGLASPERPLGTFLFVGPTGVGKTELARALAAYLFGSDDRLVRIDMSEYSHGDAHSRLIGEGREDGDLTGPVRRQPFSVVLLDEIEKAHPGVYDLLLQVLGEARLTDVNGRVTRFQNTIVIMTSNLGVDTLKPAIGFGEGSVADSYEHHFRKEAERFFRPEFLARIDQFIPFQPLGQAVVERVARRELDLVLARDGIRSQDVEVVVGERVAQWLAAVGTDERYGARPLKRAVEQRLVWPMARALANSRNDLEPTAVREVQIDAPDHADDDLIVRVVGRSRGGQASERRRLLEQIDAIANLRRRLHGYLFTATFGDLEWEVENFDLSSRSPQFWDDPSAARLAQRAETARRVVEPAEAISGELAALEDLASEAYHTRSFALATDLTDRLAELERRVGTLVMEVLRAAYEKPDETAVFIANRGNDERWVARLAGWMKGRCDARGWTCTYYEPVAGEEPETVSSAFDEDRAYWQKTDTIRGPICALHIEGEAVRPLFRAEHGLHRVVSHEGNTMMFVAALDEYSDWRFPWRLRDTQVSAQIVRVWHLRNQQVQLRHGETLKFNADAPYAVLEPELEDIAWEITEEDWE